MTRATDMKYIYITRTTHAPVSGCEKMTMLSATGEDPSGSVRGSSSSGQWEADKHDVKFFIGMGVSYRDMRVTPMALYHANGFILT